MAIYTRFNLLIEESTNSDYSNPNTRRAFSETYTPDETSGLATIEVTNAATDLPSTHLATCSKLFVKNLDASTTVRVVVTSLVSTSLAEDAPKFDVLPGEFIVVTDVDPSTSPTAAAAAGTVKVQYYFIGS